MLETLEYEQITQIRMSRVHDGRPIYWVAAYLVDGLLIDTGCRHTASELDAFLQDRSLTLAVNTHYHEDHIGANHVIMEHHGVDIYAHPTSLPLIAQTCTLSPYQELAWGYPEPTTVKPIPTFIPTQHYTFEVVDTPGHCAGHVSLVEPSRGWCFTGDLFMRETPKFIRAEENTGEIIQSMQRLLALPAERLVLFTSVGKIVEDGRAALGACIDYLTRLAARAQALGRSGASIDVIVQELFGGEHLFAQLTGGKFSTYNLVRSLLDTVA